MYLWQIGKASPFDWRFYVRISLEKSKQTSWLFNIAYYYKGVLVTWWLSFKIVSQPKPRFGQMEKSFSLNLCKSLVLKQYSLGTHVEESSSQGRKLWLLTSAPNRTWLLYKNTASINTKEVQNRLSVQCTLSIAELFSRVQRKQKGVMEEKLIHARKLQFLHLVRYCCIPK